jgi:uncharacterized repeat protein (TIGR03803 family)
MTSAEGYLLTGLAVSGNTLFGSTSEGGGISESGEGAIYSLPTSGGTPTLLTENLGGPCDLIISNGTLYGETVDSSSLFSFPASGGTPTSLAPIVGGPGGNLILSGTTLYGTIPAGEGNPNGAVFALPLGLVTTTISLTSSHVPVYFTQHVTLTATLAAAGGTPTGTITFYDNGDAISPAQPLVAGAASFTDTTLPIGSNSITATYSGDANFASSTSASALIATVRADRTGTTPTIVSATASASTHAYTIAASVIGADTGPGGAAGLKYTWTAIRLPAGAKTPTFNVNGTKAAKNIIAHFSKDGGYVLRCEVKNAAGTAVTTDVSVTVSQKATSLKIEPHAAHIAKDATLQYTGTVLDQFGHPMRTAPALTYLVAAGDGSISSTGLFSATSIAGPVTIELEADGLSGTVGAVVG